MRRGGGKGADVGGNVGAGGRTGNGGGRGGGGGGKSWLRHKANQGWRASESPPYDLDEGDLMGALTLFGCPKAGWACCPVIGEIFGHNRLRSECLQVQPVTR